MTAGRMRALTILALLTASWCAGVVDARAQAGGKTVSAALYDNGKQLPVKEFILYTSTLIKPATSGSDGTLRFQGQDIPDGTRVTICVDKYDDGSVRGFLVTDDAIPPPEEDDALRVCLGVFVLRPDSQLIIDVGRKTVTDAAHREPGPLDGLPPGRTFTFYITANPGRTAISSTVDFCDFNATLLNNVGFTQGNCAFNGGSSTFGGGGGFLVNFLRNTRLKLAGAGGFNRFGRTNPQANGARAPIDVRRDGMEKFKGPWAGAGVQLAWHEWYFQSVFGAAWLTRDTSTTDTFTQAGRVLQALTTTRREKDTQPYVAVEGGHRIWGPFFAGVEMSFTRFEDSVKTENLYRGVAVIRVQR